MKRNLKIISSLLLVSFALTVSQCAKKKDEAPPDATCKTCKAFNPNGTIAAERKTCTALDEQAFRAENTGKEITCN
jgi:hypothetical protein